MGEIGGSNPPFWGHTLSIPLKNITQKSIMVRDSLKVTTDNLGFYLSENILLLVSMATVVMVAGHITPKCTQ